MTQGSPREGRCYAIAFLIIAALIGPFMVFHVPPGHAPDEANHVIRADSLLHGQWIGHRQVAHGKMMAGFTADSALLRVIEPPVNPALTGAQPVSPVQKWLATQVPWNARPVFVGGGSVAGYMPLPYVPQAVAIGLSRAFGLSPLAAFRSARMANFTGFLLLGGAALWFTRRGAALMFCTLLLPMTLSLAASSNQDGLLIAGSALACACLTRAGEQELTLRSPWYCAAAVLLALVAAAKPPYLPLVGLLLQPVRFSCHWRGRGRQSPRPSFRGEGWVRGLAVAGFAALPALIWVVIEAHTTAVPPLRDAAEAGPLWPGPRPAVFSGPDFAAQLRVIAAHPVFTIILPLRAMYGWSGHLLREAIGKLDFLCLVLPEWLYTAWFFGLGAALVADMSGGRPPSRLRVADFLVVIVCIMLSMIAIGLALYLDWTPVGMTWIGGIQGRYLLPLVPVFSLCLPRFSQNWTKVFYVVPVGIAAVSALALPGILAAFYPLR